MPGMISLCGHLAQLSHYFRMTLGQIEAEEKIVFYQCVAVFSPFAL